VVIFKFPDDSDLFAELDSLRRQNETFCEEREQLLARISVQEKKLRRITRLLDDLWTELH
jgi:hypothetical protein